MLKTRLIACLLLKNGLIVRSELFKYHQFIGEPITQLARYNQWGVDELIYLDISQDDTYDVKRNDAKIATEGAKSLLEIIEIVSKTCFMPLTFGGKIRSVDDIQKRLSKGADKITINTKALEDPSFITESAQIFGSQCIVVSIDVKAHDNSAYEVYSKWGKESTGRDPVEWAKEAEERGAGEIFLNSIDRDGTAKGYDLKLIKSVVEAVNIPVIACGGVGTFQHFVDGVQLGGASAVSAANIFHFTELSYKNAKKHILKEGIYARS